MAKRPPKAAIVTGPPDAASSYVLEQRDGSMQIVACPADEAKLRARMVNGAEWYHKAEDVDGRWIYRND